MFLRISFIVTYQGSSTQVPPQLLVEAVLLMLPTQQMWNLTPEWWKLAYQNVNKTMWLFFQTRRWSKSLIYQRHDHPDDHPMSSLSDYVFSAVSAVWFCSILYWAWVRCLDLVGLCIFMQTMPLLLQSYVDFLRAILLIMYVFCCIVMPLMSIFLTFDKWNSLTALTCLSYCGQW